jgi:AcrR family transcriptional regulator
MRVTQDEWIAAALHTLCTEGHAGLSAERLSRKLGVTRGSFYHHFPNMDTFHLAVLQRWQTVHTEDIIFSHTHPDPAVELARLIQHTFNMSMALENGINAWAGANSRVADFVAKVEKRRMDRLIEIYQAVCGDAEKGRRLAKIGYYGLLGAAHAVPRLSQEELRQLLMEVHELMMSMV